MRYVLVFSVFGCLFGCCGSYPAMKRKEGKMTMSAQRLTELAKEQQEYVVRVRRHIHENPELRWEETETLQFIEDQTHIMTVVKRYLNGVHRPFGGTWFDIIFDPSFDTILFRADVDALPIQEETGLEFASKIPGKMHACGHDIHAAMLLGFLRALANPEIEPKHNLRIVFQRAEENPGSEPNPKSGGQTLVEEGVLAGISRAYMLHIWRSGNAGVFYSRPGALLANSDRWKIMVKTSGGHVARPFAGTNALRVTQAIQNTLDSVATRILASHEPISIEPTILQSGTATNIMPSHAELFYGVRTMLGPENRAGFFARLEDIVKKVVKIFPNAEVSFERIFGHPMLFNNDEEFARTRKILSENDEELSLHEPVLGGEDFAYYLQKIHGCAVMLGAHQEGSGDHHSPTFNPDESVFWKGVLFWLLLATH